MGGQSHGGIWLSPCVDAVLPRGQVDVLRGTPVFGSGLLRRHAALEVGDDRLVTLPQRLSGQTRFSLVCPDAVLPRDQVDVLWGTPVFRSGLLRRHAALEVGDDRLVTLPQRLSGQAHFSLVCLDAVLSRDLVDAPGGKSVFDSGLLRRHAALKVGHDRLIALSLCLHSSDAVLSRDLSDVVRAKSVFGSGLLHRHAGFQVFNDRLVALPLCLCSQVLCDAVLRRDLADALCGKSVFGSGLFLRHAGFQVFDDRLVALPICLSGSALCPDAMLPCDVIDVVRVKSVFGSGLFPCHAGFQVFNDRLVALPICLPSQVLCDAVLPCDVRDVVRVKSVFGSGLLCRHAALEVGDDEAVAGLDLLMRRHGPSVWGAAHGNILLLGGGGGHPSRTLRVLSPCQLRWS